MKTVCAGGWVFYIGDDHLLNDDKCGKWMYFFSDRAHAENLCMEAVQKKIVAEAKHTDSSDGVACFYLNGDDLSGHKKILQYFLDNNLIRRTKTGKLYNISFKYDNQTRNREYGDRFQGEIKLAQFIDLSTGEWLI